tara:strand:- start:334 stop:681 length:348 start_codon:yes stop_codon:yes gene_type:complete
MPFALIPEGFKLQKVTKAQERAVNEKRRHDDMIALLNNPETVSSAVTLVIAYFTAKAGKDALDDLKDLGVNITQDVEDAYTKKRTFVPGQPIGVSLEQIVESGLEKLLDPFGRKD